MDLNKMNRLRRAAGIRQLHYSEWRAEQRRRARDDPRPRARCVLCGTIGRVGGRIVRPPFAWDSPWRIDGEFKTFGPDAPVCRRHRVRPKCEPGSGPAVRDEP